jgi:hypothetical protein
MLLLRSLKIHIHKFKYFFILKMSKSMGCIDFCLLMIIVISIVITIELMFFTNDNMYLYERYNDNWNQKYINNIQVVESGKDCPAEHELVILGTWSGIDSKLTYCKNNYVNHTYIKDKEDNNTSYRCAQLVGSEPVNITEYKGTRLCIRRSISNIFSYEKNYSYASDEEFFKSLVEKRFSTNASGIVDIKILDKGMDKDIAVSMGIDIEKYEKVYDDKYILYVKRIGLDNANIFELNDLIVNIHLYNHLQCALLDMAIPDSYYPGFDNIDLGYKSCNQMYKKTKWFYNDDGKRSDKINLFEYSYEDIYPASILKAYKDNNVDFFINGNPKYLVSEKYFYGLSCKDKPLSDHLDNLKLNKTLRSCGIILLILQLLNFIFMSLYFCYKYKERKRPTCIFLFIIILIIGASIFLSIAASIISKQTENYFTKYESMCQKDFTAIFNRNKESEMEIAFKEDLSTVFINMFILFIIQCFAGLFSILGFFNNCCCWKTKDEPKEVEMKNENSVNRA